MKRVSEYSGRAASTVPSGGTRKGERHLGDRECEASGVQGASKWDWAQEPGYIDS